MTFRVGEGRRLDRPAMTDRRIRGVAFIVELGEALSDDKAVVHADAVRTIAAEV